MRRNSYSKSSLRAMAATSACAMMLASMCGCSKTSTATTDTQDAQTPEANTGKDGYVSAVDTSSLYTDRDISGNHGDTTVTIDVSDASTMSSTEGISYDSSTRTMTISKDGTYVLSGSSDDISIVIDAPDDAKVQLVLSGVNMSSSQASVIYAKSADKLFVTAESGTTNTLSASGASYDDGDTTVDGTVFSTCDLTMNGDGSTSVTSASGNGIVCKDDLRLVSGTIDVTASLHAIQANDSIAIRDGSYDLSAGTDGIHCSNDDDTSI